MAPKMPRLRRNIILIFLTWFVEIKSLCPNIISFINTSALPLRMMTNLANLAWILIIFSNALKDFGIVYAATIAAVLDCPAGLLATLFVHQLGKRPTVWGCHFGTVLCTVLCAILIGK